MNKNLVIVLILIVLVGGFVLLQNKSKTQAPVKTTVENQTPSVAKENKITLTSDGFEPKSITVKVGEEVVWLNKSGAVATVNSAQHPTHLVYPKLNLGKFEDSGELKLVFDKAGKYNFHNHLNASQFGTVVVE